MIKHKIVFTSTIINIVTLVLFACVGGVNYEVSDDWNFSLNILDSNYNYIFNSYFIQFISGVLQNIIYPINAYMALQIVISFIAVTSLMYVLMDTFSYKKGIVFSVVISLLYSINFYSAVTFTVTAVALIVSGCIFFIYSIIKNKKIGYSIFSILLILFGSFYRIDIFYSVFAIFVVFIFVILLSFLKRPLFKNIKSILLKVFKVKNIVLFMLILVSVFSFEFLSQCIIRSENGMNYYYEYNPARANVIDYEMPSYENHKDEYEKIGFSENDLKMLQSWYFDDEGATDLETLKELHQIQLDNKISLEYLVKNMISVTVKWIVTLSSEGIIMLLFIILCIGVLVCYKRKSWLFVILIGCISCLLYFYLWYKGRYVYRALFSIWFTASIFLLYSTVLMEKRKWFSKITKNRKTNITLGVVAIFISIFAVLPIHKSINEMLPINQSDFNKIANLYNYIESSDNMNFALSSTVYNYFKDSVGLTHPLIVVQDKIYNKCAYYTNSYYAHPSYYKFLKKFNVNNLYRDIIDNDKFYFVDNEENIDVFIKYLNDYYSNGKTIYYKTVKKVDDFLICKVYSR